MNEHLMAILCEAAGESWHNLVTVVNHANMSFHVSFVYLCSVCPLSSILGSFILRLQSTINHAILTISKQVQHSYVSFQQALAALPASIPTGLITGLHQQCKSALIFGINSQTLICITPGLKSCHSPNRFLEFRALVMFGALNCRCSFVYCFC